MALEDDYKSREKVLTGVGISVITVLHKAIQLTQLPKSIVKITKIMQLEKGKRQYRQKGQ